MAVAVSYAYVVCAYVVGVLEFLIGSALAVVGDG